MILGGKRLEELEREVARLDRALAEARAEIERAAEAARESAAAVEGRFAALAGQLAELERRVCDGLAATATRGKAIVDEQEFINGSLAELEDRLAAERDALSARLDETGRRLDERVAPDNGELARLRATLARAEKRLELHVEDTDRLGQALLERIERTVSATAQAGAEMRGAPD